jgi:hypothetical protein
MTGNSFLPDPSKFIMNQFSSYHSTLYSLDADSDAKSPSPEQKIRNSILTQDNIQWRALVNAAMNTLVRGKFMV